jgi:hypothetical protein
MKKILYLFFLLFFVNNIFAQLRSFDNIFPNLNQDIKNLAFSETGYVKHGQKSGGFMLIGNDRGSRLDPQIVNYVLRKNPGYLVESILVIRVRPGSVTLLDIYNALRNVRDLQGRLYNSATRNQAVPLFEEATRIVSDRQMTPIPDPPPSRMLPMNETVFIKLKDVNFGNTFYRGEMTLFQSGLRYILSNFKSMSYLFIPIIKEDKFIAQLYFEPIQEGVLIYSVAGAEISDFFASKIDMDSAISKRLNVMISWAVDGITKNQPTTAP